MSLAQTFVLVGHPQVTAEPPLLDAEMHVDAWPNLVSAAGVLITRVSAIEVRLSPILRSACVATMLLYSAV
jgi:hypothetical protein